MGYRLIRSKELERERAAAANRALQDHNDHVVEVSWLNGRIAALLQEANVAHGSLLETLRSAHTRERELLEQLADQQGKLQAALTHADLVTTRVNVLENEVAQFRQIARPDIKQSIPAIGKAPIGSALYEGAGADLFEDVGDVEAERLRALGVLHDPGADVIAPVSGASLAPEFSEP